MHRMHFLSERFQSTGDKFIKAKHYIDKRTFQLVFIGRARKILSEDVTVISKLPDFDGCAKFGRSGRDDPRKCTLVTLPIHLREVDLDIVKPLIEDSKRSVFPEPLIAPSNYPPYCASYTGTYLISPGHMGEKVGLHRVQCSAEYDYYFLTTI